MSERMKKQFEGKKLKQETNPKLTGAISILVAVLIFALGFLVHYIQIGSLPNDAVVDLLVAQLNMKFATDFLVGFLTGIGAVVGIYYLMQKPKETEQNAQA
jgi:uncharacterized membrane protein